jgi:hypothetical protein
MIEDEDTLELTQNGHLINGHMIEDTLEWTHNGHVIIIYTHDPQPQTGNS